MKSVLLVLPAMLAASCAPFDTDEEIADHLYRRALERKAAGADPEGLREILSEAIELDPERADFYLTRAIVHRALYRTEEAEADYTLAIGILKRSPAERSELGAAYLARAIARAESSRPAEAELDFAECLKLSPTHVEAYIYRSRFRRAAGRILEADDDLALARKYGAGQADAYHNAAIRALKNMRSDEADRLFSLAVDLDPGHIGSWTGLARCAMERGRYARATQAFTRAIELEPQWAELYYYRANAFRALEKWEEAFEDSIRALDRDPRNPLHYVLRGVIYRQYYKDTENAERDFNQAIQLDPSLPGPYLERGILYHQMRLLNDAERDLRQSLSRHATPEGIIALGRVLRDKGEYEKAIESYRRALEIYPDPETQKILKDELERVLQAKETEK